MAEMLEALPEKAAAVSASRMGRPALKVKKTTVRLPEGVFAQIEALVGQHRMATFIRDAVAEKLARDEPAELRKREKPSKG